MVEFVRLSKILMEQGYEIHLKSLKKTILQKSTN